LFISELQIHYQQSINLSNYFLIKCDKSNILTWWKAEGSEMSSTVISFCVCVFQQDYNHERDTMEWRQLLSKTCRLLIEPYSAVTFTCVVTGDV